MDALIGLGRIRGAFGGRGFTAFWIAGTLMTTGRWALNVAASVHIHELTGSPLMVGLVNVATFAPIFVFSAVGGVLSDRFSRRRLVMIVYAFASLVTVSLAVITFAGRATASVLVVASLIVGTTNAFAKPSLSALVAALVPREDLSRASAINTLQFFVGQVAGSALASLLLVVAGPGWAFTTAAALLLGQVVVMPLLRPVPRRHEDRIERATFGELADGLRVVRRHGVMVAVLGTVVIANGMAEAVRTLAPGFAVEALGREETAGGIIITALSLGSAVGSLVFAPLSRRVGEGRLLWVGFVGQGVACVALAMSPSLAVAIVTALVLGVGVAFIIPMLSATMLRESTDRYRGRVMSTFAMANLGLRPLGALVAGTLATFFPSRVVTAGFAALAVVGLVALRRFALVATIEGVRTPVPDVSVPPTTG